MVVHPGTEERDLVVAVHVAARELGQLLRHLLLGDAVGKVERAVEPNPFRDVGEQPVERVDADRRQHLLPVALGGRRVPAHAAS